MVKFLISRPIAVIMVFIAVLMLGIVSYKMLPVSLMPAIDIPEITVQVSYPNSSARELDNAVIKGLRSQLVQVANLDDIKSETRDGQSTIRLMFDYGTKIDYAFIEVNEKIDEAMNYLPRDMDRPRVIKASASDLPEFYINVSLKADSLQNTAPGSDKFTELSEFCENLISRRIEQLPQVAMVDLSGATKPEVFIKPDKVKMESLGLTYDHIKNAINESNITPGNLLVREGYYIYHIRFASYLKSPDDIGNIYIHTGGKVLQLKDIAEITIRPREQRGLFVTGGKQAVTMAIIQQSDAKVSELKTEIHNMVQRFREEYPLMEFEISRDQTSLLDFSISNLRQDLIMGCLMAFLLLFVFLSDFRAPVLIGITIPVSLVISLLFFNVIGISINIISIAGLGLGLGMIIDCSIIVIENISYYRDKGLSLSEACIRGTNEVIRPMLSSTLTTSSVFIPLIFMSGLAGALFYDEAMSVSIGNAASFIVAITILPVLFALFYKKRIPSELSNRGRKRQVLLWIKEKLKGLMRWKKPLHIEKSYEKGLEWVFGHKKTVLVMFTVLLVSGVLWFALVRKEKFPDFRQDEIMVNIDWNENIHIDENRQRIDGLVKSIAGMVKQSNCLIGEQQFVLKQEKDLDYFEAEIYLKMRNTDSVTIAKDSIQHMVQRQYPQAQVTFRPPSTVFERMFSNNDPPLMAMVSITETANANPDSILYFATLADSTLRTSIPNKLPVKMHIAISIDQEKLLLYNVGYNTVLQTINTAFNENKITTLRSYQQFLPVVLGDDAQSVNKALAERKVTNNKGQEFPLMTFIDIHREFDLKYITAGQQGWYIPLQYQIKTSETQNYQRKIKELARANKYKDVSFSGSILKNQKMFAELTIILIISVLLLYFILAAQFESLLLPIIVLLEIPADISGALFLLWAFGYSLNIMSGIGIIIMCGVIINDSILKVDTINQLRRQGMELIPAIKHGGVMRLGSIVMTALITIFAVLPFFFGNDMGSELQKPLSLALIGGMVFGTLVSLYFIPVAYWAIYRKERKSEELIVKSEGF
ncbi:MAG TPA: efflux RND transporter permease subunit [Bacteroidales bacterium]|nr:efflux RND transporter permease subunit [Bacteroidales bacterium]